MSSVLKISEAASLAMHAAALLAANPERPYSTREMAEMLLVSEAHLSKVLQQMARAGLVRSARGPGGGFRLGRPSSRIRLLEIYELIEGRLTRTDCLLATKACSGGGCIFGGFLESVNRQFRDYLAKTPLSKLAHLLSREEVHA